MDEPRYEYDNFKVDQPKVDDGWYLVKDGMTYRVDVPIGKMRFTKSVNILTGEVYYPSNADRIRAMTDEELADWLEGIRLCCATDLCGEDCPLTEVCHYDAGTPTETLDWLKQEAE